MAVKKINISLDEDILKQLDEMCQEYHISRSALLTLLVVDKLKNKDEKGLF